MIIHFTPNLNYSGILFLGTQGSNDLQQNMFYQTHFMATSYSKVKIIAKAFLKLASLSHRIEKTISMHCLP